jgi:glycerate 2-kinase
MGVRVLIAPDKFKGSFSAPAAALAIAEGIRRVHPDAIVSSSPVADGGSGTLEALLDSVGGEKVYVTTTDAWGAHRRAPIALLDDGDVCIEAAESSTGDPMRADSGGLGTLLLEAAERAHPDHRVLVAVGGTASTDGGTGLARSLGWRFLDDEGREVPRGGAGLASIARIERPEAPLGTKVLALCDVDAPLTGEDGSARRYSPQKGASPDQVELLERGLSNLAARVRDATSIEMDRAFGGAGGGIGAGLFAFAGADLHSGFSIVAESMRLSGLISAVDAVVTGEGRFDEQSLRGKAPIGVARAAHDSEVPCLGLFGELAIPVRAALTAGFSDVLSLMDHFGDRLPRDPAERLTEGARMLFARLPF